MREGDDVRKDDGDDGWTDEVAEWKPGSVEARDCRKAGEMKGDREGGGSTLYQKGVMTLGKMMMMIIISKENIETR